MVQRNAGSPRTCTICDATFQPYHHRHTVCSKPCREEGARRRTRAWNEQNPDRRQAYYASHYSQNRDEQRAAAKAWYQQNRAKRIKRARQWALENPDRHREIKRRYKKTDRGRLVDLANVHVRLARKRGAPGRATPEQLTARWAYYGGCCWMCPEPATQWDHVIPLSRGGSNWPSNLRPACRPCNQRKGSNGPGLALLRTAAEHIERQRRSENDG